MALTTATIEAIPYILVDGRPAVVGDQLIIAIDQEAFPGATDILATITSVTSGTFPRRDCPTQLECGTAYEVEFDDSMLPEGLSELRMCDVASVVAASCCRLLERVEPIKVRLQTQNITETNYYTQLRVPEDIDIYAVAFTIDEWPSIYSLPGTFGDVDVNLGVSAVGGNTYASDVSGTDTTLLRATPETWKKTTLASPVRIEAGRQIYVQVTDNGSTNASGDPHGLGVWLYYRLASE